MCTTEEETNEVEDICSESLENGGGNKQLQALAKVWVSGNKKEGDLLMQHKLPVEAETKGANDERRKKLQEEERRRRQLEDERKRQAEEALSRVHEGKEAKRWKPAEEEQRRRFVEQQAIEKRKQEETQEAERVKRAADAAAKAAERMEEVLLREKDQRRSSEEKRRKNVAKKSSGCRLQLENERRRQDEEKRARIQTEENRRRRQLENERRRQAEEALRRLQAEEEHERIHTVEEKRHRQQLEHERRRQSEEELHPRQDEEKRGRIEAEEKKLHQQQLENERRRQEEDVLRRRQAEEERGRIEAEEKKLHQQQLENERRRQAEEAMRRRQAEEEQERMKLHRQQLEHERRRQAEEAMRRRQAEEQLRRVAEQQSADQRLRCLVRLAALSPQNVYMGLGSHHQRLPTNTTTLRFNHNVQTQSGSSRNLLDSRPPPRQSPIFTPAILHSQGRSTGHSGNPLLQLSSLQARRPNISPLHMAPNQGIVDAPSERVVQDKLDTPSGQKPYKEPVALQRGVSARNVATMSFFNPQVGKSSASSSPKQAPAKPNKKLDDPIQILSTTALAFLKTLGITTGREFLSTPTPKITNAYRIWRAQHNMVALSLGELHTSYVRRWKALVRKGTESPEESDDIAILGAHSFKFGVHDVLCVQGASANNNSGNIKFRSFVKGHKLRWEAAGNKRSEKSKVIREVVGMWRALDPPGRFLECEDASRYIWSDVGDEMAYEKVAQCFRNFSRQQHGQRGPTRSKIVE